MIAPRGVKPTSRKGAASVSCSFELRRHESVVDGETAALGRSTLPVFRRAPANRPRMPKKRRHLSKGRSIFSKIRAGVAGFGKTADRADRKSTRLNSSH